MPPKFSEHLQRILSEIASAGLGKRERVIETPQGPRVAVAGSRVLNFCANNYLGLADHPAVVAAAHAGLDRWGYGMASVRFICGTQTVHKQLEERISSFLGTDDTILYSSCFDANGGVFETLLGEEDAVISDELNHASIIDGIRLSKARRYRYRNADAADLEARLAEADAAGARFKLVVTDGVFSMDGVVAPLAAVCAAAARHGALVMVDDSHGVGFMGPGGRGTAEHHGVADQVDITTGTLGKALGGAIGGYVSGRREIIALLRQRSRPYLFSNTLPPSVAAASLAAIDLVERSPELRERLHANTRYFREGLAAAGLQVRPGTHPIVPVMLGDAALSQRFAARMLEKGVYVVGFFHPVVPQGAARIRVQVSAAHSREDLDAAIKAFSETRKELAA
ncbi:MAG TPA: glycine C-acetyltransferase [Opitutaceae bacterium]|jgi:glycine C-acetyltransferase